MATLANLDVELRANTSALQRGFSQAQRRTEALRKAAIRLGGALVAAVGARQIVRGLNDILRTFGQQQEAVQQLRGALIATGRDGGNALEMLTQRAAELQAVTTKGDEATIEATATFAQLATALDASELAKAQKAIIGIADTFVRGNLNNAAIIVGKSISSSTNALIRYGIQVDTTATQSEKLNQILEQSNKFFSVSKARTDTLLGRLQQLSNAWGDLKEAIGQAISSGTGLEDLIVQVKKVITDLTTVFAAGEFQRGFLLAGKIAATAFVQSWFTILPKLQEAVLKAILPDAVVNVLNKVVPGLALARAGFAKSAEFFQRETEAAIRKLKALAAQFGGPGGTPGPGGITLPIAVAVDKSGLLNGLEDAGEELSKFQRDVRDIGRQAGRSFIQSFIEGTLNVRDLLRRALADLASNFILGTIESAFASGGGASLLPAAREVDKSGMSFTQTVNFTVQAIDSRDARRFVEEQAPTIASVVGKAARENTGFRSVFMGR